MATQAEVLFHACYISDRFGGGADECEAEFHAEKMYLLVPWNGENNA